LTNQRARILILDDVEINRLLIRDALTGIAAKADLVEADTCAAAHALLRTETFDLLLLDIQLPDGRGDHLLQAIRLDPQVQSRHAPAIAITGELDQYKRQALQAAGFVEVLAKPWNVQHLQHTIVSQLPYSMLPATANAVAEPAPQSHIEIHGFDTERALKMVGNNPQLMDKMRSMFLAELRRQSAMIKQAHAQNNWSSIQETIHQLAASAGFTGAQAIEAAIESYRLKRSVDPSAATLDLLAVIDGFLVGR
jgi:CheY-like chemotaxis protein